MNQSIVLAAAVTTALLMGCGKVPPKEKEYGAPKALGAAPLAPPSESFYKDPDYILDATVKTESVETAVTKLASSVKLDPNKTYKVEIKIFESK